MYTVCPDCKAVFRVGAQHLQVAGGSVCCGKCSHTFNALLFLTEDPPAADAVIPTPIKQKTDEPVVEPDNENDADVADLDDTQPAANDDLSDEDASSTATGFAARIRRFLDASSKNPELKEDDTWSTDDANVDADKFAADAPDTDVDGELADDMDASTDESVLEDDIEDEAKAEDIPVLEVLSDTASDGAEEAVDDALESELASAEVVEDVDEFEAAVLATITETEAHEESVPDIDEIVDTPDDEPIEPSGDKDDLAAEPEEEPEKEPDEKLEVELEEESDDQPEEDIAADLDEAWVDHADEEPNEKIEDDLAALAEHVIDSMPDVVVEGQSPEDAADNDHDEDDKSFSSTADRLRTLEMLSEKEAETYFGEMLVDPDALEAEAISDSDSGETAGGADDETDPVAALLDEDSEEEEAEEDLEEDNTADEEDADDDAAEADEETDDDTDEESDEDGAEDVDADDEEWRLANEDNDSTADESDDDDSPEPVLFLVEDGDTEAASEKQESLEFNVPADQLDTVFSEAEATSLTPGAADEDEEDVDQLAASASLAVENIELGSDEKPRHDISATYKPPPREHYKDFESDRKRWWLAASIILATGLTLQLLHFNRFRLSDTFLGGALTALYGELGPTSEPEWDISQYNIQRSTAVGPTSGSGTLTIVGRLTNGADFAQPFPILRLLLLDRWGDQIGVRDLQASQYLAQPPVGSNASKLMNAFEMATIEVTVVDPDGEPAANFVIEICLPDSRGSLTCQ